jgi:hypothetical protein
MELTTYLSASWKHTPRRAPAKLLPTSVVLTPKQLKTQEADRAFSRQFSAATATISMEAELKRYEKDWSKWSFSPKSYSDGTLDRFLESQRGVSSEQEKYRKTLELAVKYAENNLREESRERVSVAVLGVLRPLDADRDYAQAKVVKRLAQDYMDAKHPSSRVYTWKDGISDLVVIVLSEADVERSRKIIRALVTKLRESSASASYGPIKWGLSNYAYHTKDPEQLLSIAYDDMRRMSISEDPSYTEKRSEILAEIGDKTRMMGQIVRHRNSEKWAQGFLAHITSDKSALASEFGPLPVS